MAVSVSPLIRWPNSLCHYSDGRLLSISDHPALFSLLGIKYGGNGRTTFALPDFSEAEKSLQGARYIIQVEGVFPSRS